jgi:thymidylate synthase
MKYKVDLVQTVTEVTTLVIEAHNEEQAELIAEYIATEGKDPWDRKFIDVTWRPDEVHDSAEMVACTESDETPCNTLPEHTEGLFADESA